MVLLNILWPTFALVLVIFAVWFTLLFQRLGHMRRNPPTAESFATGDSARAYFQPVEMANANLANLFEMPVLYFAIVPLLVLSHQASLAQIVLAWLFVLTRAVHSVLHIGRKVRQRFTIYLVSVALLMAMWIGFLIDFAAVAMAYSQAVRGVGAGA